MAGILSRYPFGAKGLFSKGVLLLVSGSDPTWASDWLEASLPELPAIEIDDAAMNQRWNPIVHIGKEMIFQVKSCKMK